MSEKSLDDMREDLAQSAYDALDMKDFKQMLRDNYDEMSDDEIRKLHDEEFK